MKFNFYNKFLHQVIFHNLEYISSNTHSNKSHFVLTAVVCVFVGPSPPSESRARINIR